MENIEEEFYVCSCGANAISLLRWVGDPDDTDISISMWERGSSGREDSWHERLRHIWHIIRKGHPFEDEVILSQDDALRLLGKLSEWTNKTSGTSA